MPDLIAIGYPDETTAAAAADEARRLASEDQVRGLLKPGTSALFLMLEKVTPDKAALRWTYGDIPPDLQRIRGPYRFSAGIEAYGQRDRLRRRQQPIPAAGTRRRTGSSHGKKG